MTILGMLLAAAAAFGFATGAWLQHAGVRGMTTGDGERLRLRAFLELLKQRNWLFGGLILLTSAGTHAVALSIAPITVVQPIGVLTLAITVMLNARVDHTRLAKRITWAVIAVTGGVIVFAPVAALHTSTAAVSEAAELKTAQVVGVLLVALGILGTVAKGRIRCLAFAVGAGVAYGMVSVFVRPLVDQLFTTGVSVHTIVTAGGMAVAAVIGLMFIQQAYASGPAAVVVACITVFDPILAVGVGVALLQEATLAAPWMLIAESLAALAAGIGVVILAAWHPDAKKDRNLLADTTDVPAVRNSLSGGELPAGTEPVKTPGGVDTAKTPASVGVDGTFRGWDQPREVDYDRSAQ